ncbi:hypothetical protein [Sporolactobacillus laevolacticus]|uniref:Uncharacterized protein n=1 Tax=Sporolactobacillus laevolacticus DSM 442 TaxID=1395513 RepID=V6IXH4_9BACL|nr:hypothetical protein [Sporolactobacillus laevolacticus]EST12047.1 hypothetical protein P343_07950 [Sporolactobacillus laevolacticus DSM 442]
MVLYKFKRLMDKYNVNFNLIVDDPKAGHWEAGEWVPGSPEPIPGHGSIVPMPQSLIYQSGGTLTAFDRIIYTDMVIPLQSHLDYNGAHYTVTSKIPYSEYADFDRYILKSDDTQTGGGSA